MIQTNASRSYTHVVVCGFWGVRSVQCVSCMQAGGRAGLCWETQREPGVQGEVSGWLNLVWKATLTYTCFPQSNRVHNDDDIKHRAFVCWHQTRQYIARRKRRSAELWFKIQRVVFIANVATRASYTELCESRRAVSRMLEQRYQFVSAFCLCVCFSFLWWFCFFICAEVKVEIT